MSNTNYSTQMGRKNTLLLREVLKELPAFCADFFRGIEQVTSPLTRLNYAYDLRLFFEFLCEEVAAFSALSPTGFSLDALKAVTTVHLEMYLEFLTYYQKGEQIFENNQAGKERKLSSVRTLFKYFFKKELIPANVAALVDLPKKHEKPIIRLEPDEVAKLLDLAEDGQGLSNRQKKYHELTKVRDVAMLSLFLSTGIRVSECVGLDVQDLDFTANSFRIIRKGGDAVILYFPDEIVGALRAYLALRNEIVPLPGHENALFLSLQKRRLDVRSVQNLVKKYATSAAPLKKISPHKLRSTFGTALYQQTGDIYLVADVLGHSDVNTTRRHYAAMSDENRRLAARSIKLRDSGEDEE